MPKFTFTQEHKLGDAEAIQRIGNLVVELKKDFKELISDVKESWNDNHAIFSFKLMGGEITGDVLVNHNDALLTVKYPLLLLPFKGRVEQAIREKAKELLDPDDQAEKQ